MSLSSPPKRILLFIHSMSGGGSERQMSYLANELTHLASIRLVTLDRGQDCCYELLPSIERVGLNMNRGKGGWINGVRDNKQRVQSLRQQIASWNPDLLVSFCDSNNILAILAAKNRVPTVISERSDPRRQKLGFVWEWLRRFTYPYCTRCIVQTRDVGDYLIANQSMSPKQLTIIPSAVKIPMMELNQKLSNKTNNQLKQLVFVGRLSREKNVDGLIHSWSLLRSYHAEWRLKIVGDGPERNSLQELAKKLNIAETVDWALWSNDVWSVFQNADAFCLVSHYEGFSQSMLEAMASGLPIAVTDCSPSIRETVYHEENGLIIPPPANPRDIATSLARILSDPILRREIGARAAIKAREYDWQSIAPRWIAECNHATSQFTRKFQAT